MHDLVILRQQRIPIFIDTEYDTWNMDPVALEKAFEMYPEVKVVVTAHLYGTPGKVDEIKDICKKHGAVIVEDAAESLGATYKGVQTGTFGNYNCISFNGNKIITGSAGGMLLTDDKDAAEKVRKWSTQSRENAPWYQHEELGYNYRMSNVIAGVVRGQFPYLEEHIAQKKAIYERYREGFKDLPVQMNPYDEKNSEPNFWLSCMIIDPEAMCKQVRGECEALYVSEAGKSCPTEILEAIAAINAEGRPIWKPMHGVSCFKYKYMLGVSDSVFDEFIFGKVFKKKERIIGNPISITSVQEKAQIAECKDSYDMVFLGRLSEQKNPEAFVEIVKEVKKQLPVHAVMIGDGELKEKVASKIQKNGLQEVIELKGFLENPYGILGNSKVLCMPSRWEGFGLAAVEALALGKPVIATGVGGLPGFIDESCGKICSSKDEFIQESYYLLKDINYYQKKSQGAVFRANKLDNISKYIRNIEVIYERS